MHSHVFLVTEEKKNNVNFKVIFSYNEKLMYVFSIVIKYKF